MITIPLAGRPIHVGAGALDRLVDDVTGRPGRRVVVTDETVAGLHAAPLARRIGADLLAFPPGEGSKTRETKARLEDRLVALGAGRDTTIVAVGGGVVGDLAGFLAATWARGVPLLQVPTTVLAMADAAIGGKTGVDLPGGKNLVGAFHPAEAVYADPAVLGTLADDAYRAGFAEVVKAGAIASAPLLRALERGREALRARDRAALEEVLAAAVRIKARIVARDPREAGPRAALNFGHTAAHALEEASGWALPHGPAVAIGMLAEARLAEGLHGFPRAHTARLGRLLEGLGLPTAAPAGLDPARVREAARRDKKGREGRVRCALPVRLGRMPAGPDPTVEVEAGDLLAALGLD